MLASRRACAIYRAVGYFGGAHPVRWWYGRRSVAPEEAAMANKDKGGSKSSKTAASKTLKEKRAAKKAKASGTGSSSSDWTKK